MQTGGIRLIYNELYYNKNSLLQSFLPIQPIARLRTVTTLIVCVAMVLRGPDSILLNIVCTSRPSAYCLKVKQCAVE